MARHLDSRSIAVEEPATMSQPRTISLLPLSLIGLVLLVVGPALVRAQSTLRPSHEHSPYKGFSGLWARSDSMKQVYQHEQTVAVVELGPGKNLENCELVEVTTPKEKSETLKVLRPISHPIAITFEEMMELMSKCHQLVSPLETVDKTEKSLRAGSVLQGIAPGTKWCGNNDIARTFFDLGREKDVDKCCRSHDLCPVKVRPYRTRYDVTNENFFTISHCSCDNSLWDCLKTANTPLSSLIGTVYFNIMKIPCVQDTDPDCSASGCVSRKIKKPRQFT